VKKIKKLFVTLAVLVVLLVACAFAGLFYINDLVKDAEFHADRQSRRL